MADTPFFKLAHLGETLEQTSKRMEMAALLERARCQPPPAQVR